MVSLDSSSCFAFDFEYSSSGGVSSDPDVYPTVQTVFAYTCIEPHGDGAFAVSLRTRIETFRFDLGRYPLEMMSNCRMEETMVLLVHKVVLEARKRGIIEARNLLHDWLVILYAKYNKCFSRSKTQATATLDFAFTKAQATRPTSRQCARTLPFPPPLHPTVPQQFAHCHLCHSQVAAAVSCSSAQGPQAHDATRAQEHAAAGTRRHSARARGKCEHLWVLSEARAAQFCLLLVCPQLCGWVSSSDGEPVPLALSPESVYNSGQKIFVLDSFINVGARCTRS